ncbi:MAG: DoxX family protein [Deltaproteobacteria bacterium]|nr:MAG: DoxX family protein [Deltaproteobacteria bacterium]TMB26178.1 MAG: DoxX family protein [Deltaproteobacteria bacterium]TMB32422.1 MAG: DoxX family protein [Deltaproteobacteria bacterium]
MFARLMRTTDDGVATLLRLVLGVVFFPHGAQKVLGWFGGYGFHATLQGMSKMLPAWLVVIVMLAEFAGSLGLILGFLTRIAAFGIGCVMVGAVLTVHGKFGFFMNWAGKQPGEGFEYHLIALAIAVALMIRGGGAASIDLALTRGSARTTPAMPRF